MQITTRNEIQYTPTPAPAQGICREQPAPDQVRRTHRERHRHEAENGVDARHVQRTLKHLVRDVRSDIKNELAELAAAGNLVPQYAEAVKSLVHDFRDDLQDIYRSAGRTRELDPAALREGIGQAMAALTEGLAALREAREDVATVPVESPVPAPPAVEFTAQVSVSYGLIVDLQA